MPIKDSERSNRVNLSTSKDGRPLIKVEKPDCPYGGKRAMYYPWPPNEQGKAAMRQGVVDAISNPKFYVQKI